MTIEKSIALAFATLVITACSASADDYVEVYEDGIARAEVALTKKKLHKITYDVQDDVTGLQNRIGPQNNLSEDDHRRIFDAQNKFYDAVEKRDKELSE